MESDGTMGETVGMRLQLKNKRALTIGINNLELHGAYGSVGGCPCKRIVRQMLIVVRPGHTQTATELLLSLETW